MPRPMAYSSDAQMTARQGPAQALLIFKRMPFYRSAVRGGRCVAANVPLSDDISKPKVQP